MKIAFVIGAPVTHSGHGVVSQGMTWKKGLEERGHEVVLVQSWNYYDWKSFDAILFFMYNEFVVDYINAVSKVNPNIYYAPVLDPDFSIFMMKAISNWGCSRLKIYNRYYKTKRIFPCVKYVLVRSEFEAKYVEKGWNVPKEKILKVPLSFNLKPEVTNFERENYCFHASYLADARKNVKRLIDSAKKYGFELKLAGKLRNSEEERTIYSWIGDAKNISYLGFLSKEDLLSHYTRAKVFALPSTNEGVGIVALDAASMGCDVVITNLGGPQEYYNGLATLVNPYDIDEIGKAIQSCLNGKTNQPALQRHIHENYSLQKISEILENAFRN